jgi:hypothetical protein
VILLVAVPAVALFLAWRWIETPVPPTMPPPRRRDETGCTAECSEGHTYGWPCEFSSRALYLRGEATR